MSTTPDPTPETVNPYRAPATAIDEQEWTLPTDPAARRREHKYAKVGRVVVTWEKLRVVYNVILALTTVAFVALLVTMRPVGLEVVRIAVVGALIANVFYCAGPLVDGYLTWLGFRSPVVTSLLFVMGTLLSMLLAIMCLANPEF